MKKLLVPVLVLAVVVAVGFMPAKKDLKVFISVDMEGVAGVVNWEEVSRTGKDYDLFRELMTKETNAAIEGAIAAGATEIVVRDSHGSARNILPDQLHTGAKLLRDWSGGPLSMMEGIDESFDAVIFVGYHAKAGTPDAPLAHTMSSSTIDDVSVNGVSLPEAGINALIAGYYDVPVVFLAGDRAICEQAKGLFGTVETGMVKEGIGTANLNLHPLVAGRMINQGVKKALKNLEDYKPYKLEAPYTLELKLKQADLVDKGLAYSGATKKDDFTLVYKSVDMMEIWKAFQGMRN
ncbi:MAG: M55 family metallopeptidase [Planctomycetes bacterium]|nr:M55 family metallopeptidase [Planctomycetota bacterium]